MRRHVYGGGGGLITTRKENIREMARTKLCKSVECFRGNCTIAIKPINILNTTQKTPKAAFNTAGKDAMTGQILKVHAWVR
jgi:hypothetical protein